MKDTRVDLYIENSQEFAKPILTYLRTLIHETIPGVSETMKWSFPHFEYKKANLCSFAAFKNHCSFSFWFSTLMDDPDKVLKSAGEEGMGNLGKMNSLQDLPNEEILTRLLFEACRVIDSGSKIVKKPLVKEAAELVVPAILQVALDQNEKAKISFEKFSPSHRKEYINWINEAKTEPTRIKRLETAIEWLAEGKNKNWKYNKC